MLTLVGAVVVVVAVLVYALPRESKFGYEYEQGKPWRYNSLIASFDFPIYKTAEEVKAERDSALRSFQPFYAERTDVAADEVASFVADARSGRFGKLPAGAASHVAEMLMKVYEAGIVESTELSRMATDRVQGIRVVEGTSAVSRPIGSLYSTRAAYEYIVHSDTLRFAPEVLARIGLNEYLTPNLVLDTAKTSAAREDVIASVSLASGMVQSGQRIIDRGEIVSAEQYKILQSFERESDRRNDPSEGMWRILLGDVIFIGGVLVAFVAYLRLFRRDYLHAPHAVLLLATLVSIFPLITYIFVNQKATCVFIIPYAMVPIFVRIFMDSRTAFMAMITSTLLSSLALHTDYEFLVVQTMAGTTAICALRDLSERSQLLRVVFLVFLVSSLILLGYDLSQGIDFAHLDTQTYFHIALNGVLLLFAYPLLYVIEKAFGFTSTVTLIELSNTNNAILRRMSKEAQGTFVHSMQVANLAAEVADKIGAKAQLARTGALYHDIGKILNPAFFTENQSGVNPHNELREERSAAIIISHVTDGLKLAEKYRLPRVIRDFIATHHGRSQTKYFFIQWQNRHPGEEVNVEAFTYPGPNPFTREQAIVMMCDAVEASSRSLAEYSEEKLKELVDRIIEGQVSAGYFRDCPITFRDISDAKRVLVDSLKTIYHTRIAYPEQKPQGQEAGETKRSYFFGRRR